MLRSNYCALECFGRFAGELIFIFLGIFSKWGTAVHLYIPSLVVVSFGFCFP